MFRRTQFSANWYMRVCVRLLFDLIYICDYNVIKFCQKVGFRQVPESELPAAFGHHYKDCDFFDGIRLIRSQLMASSKEYLEFILEQLSDLDDVTYRAMMGEFIIYYRGKIVGGIYDDRLLVKPVKSAIMYMLETVYELPYNGAKEMLFVDNVDNREFLTGLFNAMYDELPTPRKKKTC